ncbi:MAG: sigma-70 family RNA polymerase sigma factor [Saprospiraceae bacterium]|nr:sigma-70 family RNA polymerase sigma factor [Saprospiraceae bacterium]
MNPVLDQSELDNSKLIRQIKSGDESALQLLYQKYAGALLHHISKIIPDPEVAEEILQDVFVKIWKKIGQYDENRSRLFTWMSQIARNTAIDTARLVSFQRNKETESIDTLVNVDAQLKAKAFNKIPDVGLQKVLSEIDPEHQELIEYLYFRQYTQKETAEALGIPLGTVKTRLRKAISVLREILTPEQMLMLMGYLLS